VYEIAGVHHVALGVKNLGAMTAFYRDVLEFKTGFVEQPAPHAVMSDITRGVTPVFTASNLSQSAGGIVVEFISMEYPSPRFIRKDFRYGDIGVNKITIAVGDVTQIYSELKSSVNFCSGPKSVDIAERGKYSFIYCRDPEGNLIELASGASLKVQGRFGAVVCAGISVSDLNRSLAFYQKYAGFDTVFTRPHLRFSGLLDEISGGASSRVRSCILSNSRGGGMIELFEVLEPRGRSIPAYTLWGDFGFHQTCLMCKSAPEIAADLEKSGMEFVVPLKRMPGDAAAFTYIRDPDGIALEFLSFGK
jgi:catechol 2,3-dioxygenase-like lactoylglutathione lyase family enzyme